MKISYFLLFLTINYSSFAAINRTHEAKDTLKTLQGVWEFQGIVIQLESPFPQTYYATDLHIRNSHFQMNLSEAAACGSIQEWENQLHFVFTCSTSPQHDTITNSWKNMAIVSLTNKEIKLSMSGVDLSYFSADLKGIGDVIFVYHRVRRKSKLLK